MRIAHLTQSYPPMISGAAISVQQTAEAMAERGHQVLVIAASDRENPYHTYTDNLTVIRLHSFNNPLRVGQRLILNPHRSIMKHLKQFQPDVIHAQEPIQMGAIALEYANHGHIPVTLTTHQLPWFVASYLPALLQPSAEIILWVYACATLKRFTSIISPTQTIANIIEAMTGLTSEVISYGVDIQAFHPPLSPDNVIASRTRLNLPPNVPLLLHVGRLDTDKSVDKVIHGAAQAIRESEAHLLIVGDGCQKKNLIWLSREMKLDEKVHFTGYVQPSSLPEIYRMADIFITASEIETQGIVLLEAAASGLPIVAVNATCIPEIVRDKVNGFLVEPGDIKGFSNSITALLNDTKRAKLMGMEGRILAEKHDIRQTWILHEKLYLEMVRKTRAQYAIKRTKLSDERDFIKTLLGLK